MALNLFLGLVILACGRALAGCPAQPVYPANELRLGVFDWAGIDNTSSVWLGNYTLSVSVNFFLAEKIFNDRRVDLFPDLERVRTCNKNLTIVKFCDVGGNPARAAYDTLWMIKDLGVQALVGYAGLEASMAGSNVAQSFDIPVVDHWVTAPATTNRRYFPMYARAIPSDLAASEVLTVLIKQLGFRTVSMLYLSDGREFYSMTADLMRKEGIEVLGVEFQYGQNNNNIRASVKKIAEQSRNVIICATWLRQLIEIADAAKEFDLLQDKNLWIHTYFNNPIGEEFHTQNSNITEIMHGSLYVSPLTDLNPNWNKYIEAYTTWESEIPRINQLVPPFGGKNSTDQCKNNMMDFQFFPGFFEVTKTYGIVIWAYIVDIILSYGFAMCDNNLDGPVPTGQDLFRRLLNVSFQGLSGSSMAFDQQTGDRDWTTAGYALLNFNLKPDYRGRTNGFTVATFDPASSRFAIDEANIVFRSGIGMEFLTQDVNPPYHEQNFLPNWSRVIGYIELAVCNLICIGCFVWLFKYRNERFLVNSQPLLLTLILLGCMIASWTILSLMVDDNPAGFGDPRVACMASPVIFCTGMGLAIAALTGKTLRVHRIFNNKRLKIRRINVQHVLSFVFVFIGTYLAVMIAWIVSAPLVWERTILFQDSLGNPALSNGMCAGNNASGAFAIVVFIFFIGALIASAFASYLVRHVSSEFQESRFVFIALISIAQVYFVAVPATFAVYSSTVGRFMILSSVVFLSAICTIACIFYPKVYYTVTGQELWAESGTNALSGAHAVVSSPPMGTHSMRTKVVMDANQVALISSTTEKSVA